MSSGKLPLSRGAPFSQQQKGWAELLDDPNAPECSHTLVIVFPTLEEFVQEREVLRNSVLPEIQQFCCDVGIDLNCCTVFETADILLNIEQYKLLLDLLDTPTVSVICFVGDKYGNSILPLELRADEFNGIRAASVETASNDVNLLESFYFPDKSEDPIVYRLRPVSTSRDTEGARKLHTVIQKCAKRAFEDGQINQVNIVRQHALYKSFIELVLDAILASNQQKCSTGKRHTIVSRKFSNYPSTTSDRLVDTDSDKKDKLETMKNSVSASLGGNDATAFHFPYLFDLHGVELQIWAKSKEAVAYEQTLFTSLIDCLKPLITQSHPVQVAQLQMFQMVPVAQVSVAQLESRTHTNFLAEISPRTWVPRKELDVKLTDLVDRLISSQNGSLFIQFHGSPGCGKSATLCRLFQLLKEKDNKCFTIIRFAHLTDTSIFVNEFLRNVFYTACDMLPKKRTDPNADDEVCESEKTFGSSFHLGTLLTQAKGLLERFDRPLVLLIDDIHLLRFGRVLGKMDQELRKLFPRFSIICSAPNAHHIPGFPMPELIELSPPSIDDSIEIVRRNACGGGKKKKLSSDVIGILRNALQKSESNLILGEVQFAEVFEGQTDVSPSIELNLQRIELRCGAENVRVVCELICCAPCGITVLEVCDAFRLRKFTTAMSFEPDDVLSVSPLIVLKYLGRLLSFATIDRRKVWTFRHASVAQAVRQRYLQSTGEIKLVNEIMVAVFRGSRTAGEVDEDSTEAAAAAAVMLFPQPLNRADNGAANTRRVRFHWYFLLYTGNVENLKMLTLCSFDYLETTFRACGLARLLSIFEECLLQILDHDLMVIFEQVLLPAVPTLVRDPRQFVSEFLNTLRYTRAKNSVHLNNLVEQAMQWTDNYASTSLLVPLTCWISPPKIKQVLTFSLPQWKSTKTIIQPTRNHQHLLVAGNENDLKSIYMFHLASQYLIRTFSGHQGSTVSALCASNDGQFFISTALDGTIKLWNLNHPEALKTLQPAKSKIFCAIIGSSDQWIAIGSSDSSARIVNIETGDVTHNFKDHTGPVVGLQLSSDNTLLVTGSGDFIVMVWDLNQKTLLLKLGGLMAPVTCLSITSNDTFLIVACEDETLRVFGLVSTQELHELSGHDSRVNAMVTSADDCQLFAATKGKVYVFDIHNGQLLEVLLCSLQLPVMSIKISDDNSFIILACGDRIHIWNNSIERDNTSTQTDTALTCVQISLDEKGAGCGTIDGILAFWDLDVCQCMWTTSQQKTGAVTAVSFTTDSFHLLSGSAQGPISLWETSNGNLIRQMSIHTEPVTAICCFTDGIRVASCDQSGQAHVWSWSEEHKRVDFLVTIPQMAAPMHIRLNDTLLIGQNATNPKEMNIWLLQTDSRPTGRAKVHHNEPIVCYDVNRVGSMLVTGSTDLSLKVWQLDSGGLLIQVLVGHESVPSCCSISEDGHIVASGGRDKNLIVWDVQTGAAIKTFKNSAILKAVELSQDANVIVSCSDDSWIVARHSDTGRLLSSFNTHRPVERLIMGADGDRILVQLSGTPQLPIICLHNSPTNLVAVSRYDSVVSETMVAGVSQSPQALGDTMPPRLGVQAGLQRDSIASYSDEAPVGAVAVSRPVEAPTVLPAHGAYPVNKETTSGDGRKQTANGQSSSSQASVVKLKTQRAPSDSKPTVASTVSNSNETNLQAGESSTNRESDQQKGKKGRPSAAGRVRSGMCAII